MLRVAGGKQPRKKRRKKAPASATPGAAFDGGRPEAEAHPRAAAEPEALKLRALAQVKGRRLSARTEALKVGEHVPLDGHPFGDKGVQHGDASPPAAVYCLAVPRACVVEYDGSRGRLELRRVRRRGRRRVWRVERPWRHAPALMRAEQKVGGPVGAGERVDADVDLHAKRRVSREGARLVEALVAHALVREVAAPYARQRRGRVLARGSGHEATARGGGGDSHPPPGPSSPSCDQSTLGWGEWASRTSGVRR